MLSVKTCFMEQKFDFLQTFTVLNTTIDFNHSYLHDMHLSTHWQYTNCTLSEASQYFLLSLCPCNAFSNTLYKDKIVSFHCHADSLFSRLKYAIPHWHKESKARNYRLFFFRGVYLLKLSQMQPVVYLPKKWKSQYCVTTRFPLRFPQRKTIF